MGSFKNILSEKTIKYVEDDVNYKFRLPISVEYNQQVKTFLINQKIKSNDYFEVEHIEEIIDAVEQGFNHNDPINFKIKGLMLGFDVDGGSFYVVSQRKLSLSQLLKTIG